MNYSQLQFLNKQPYLHGCTNCLFTSVKMYGSQKLIDLIGDFIKVPAIVSFQLPAFNDINGRCIVVQRLNLV